MAKKMQRVGGFSGFNTGEIIDCYCKTYLKSNDFTGGFCGENRGTILRCLGKGISKRDKSSKGYGLCAKQEGVLENSFWIADKSIESDLSNWDDSEHAAVDEEKIKSFTACWDKENVWYVENENVALVKGGVLDFDENEVIEIADRDGFLQFIGDVNSGNAKENTTYRLMCDIDMAGAKAAPIGADKNMAFNSCFDGNYHSIKNLKINAKEHSLGGCFGYIGKNGRVLNLTVDSTVCKSGEYTAGFCAVNDGYIAGCVAVSAVGCGKYTGGFAAENNGKIERSCCKSRITPVLIFPWWVPLAGVAGLFVLIVALLAIFGMLKGKDVFAPVIIDPNARPIIPSEEIIPPPVEEQEDSSASFIMNAQMRVDYDSYLGVIGLKCPSWSKKGFVVTAVATKEDLINNGASYKKDAVIYKSGLINPGMEVANIQLLKLPDGSKLPFGTYNIKVDFVFYDPETNERASVSSTAPLELTIE